MLGNIKPIPRFIIIAALIGGAVYGISKTGVFGGMKAPEPQVQTQHQPLPIQPQVSIIIEPPIAPQVVITPAAETPPSTSNAGIDAVLKAGTKK